MAMAALYSQTVELPPESTTPINTTANNREEGGASSSAVPLLRPFVTPSDEQSSRAATVSALSVPPFGAVARVPPSNI